MDLDGCQAIGMPAEGEVTKFKSFRDENYKQILDSGGRMNSSMKMIRSFDYDIYTVNVIKVSLSAYDDKRFILKDGVSSYAYGHFRIDEQH